MIKNRNSLFVKELDLIESDVKVGMCVYPKEDIREKNQKKGEPYLIMRADVEFYKNNASKYTYQMVKSKK